MKTAIRYNRQEKTMTAAAATRTRSLLNRTARKSGTVREPHAAAKRRIRGATMRHDSQQNTTIIAAMISHGSPYS